MDMTSDLSLQESCMAALHHMGIEVQALVYKTNELETENEKLREKYNEYESKMDDLVCKLTGGLLSKSATSLTNDALYSVVEELMTEELVDENFKLGLENAKLRDLVRDMWRFTGTACKKYPRLFDPAAQGGQMVNLNMIDAFEQRVNEMEMGVDK